MNLSSDRIRIVSVLHTVGRLCVYFAVAAALVAVGVCGAQADAPGVPVVIPGAEIAGWGNVDEVSGRFGRPAGPAARVPAVLILHGSSGVDGRGGFYARALQDAGIATLEIRMFEFGRRPKAGPEATMPYASAALRWLGAQRGVDAGRLGVMGFSWGGVMTVLLSSELVQERLGKDVPKPVAFAPLYPVCSGIARGLKNPERAFYNAQTRMSASPMLISVGTRDDYEEGRYSCEALIAMWPAAARELTTLRCIEGATHAFDGASSWRYYDGQSHGGRGGMVSIAPSPKDADETREAVVSFFVKYLKP